VPTPTLGLCLHLVSLHQVNQQDHTHLHLGLRVQRTTQEHKLHRLQPTTPSWLLKRQLRQQQQAILSLTRPNQPLQQHQPSPLVMHLATQATPTHSLILSQVPTHHLPHLLQACLGPPTLPFLLHPQLTLRLLHMQPGMRLTTASQQHRLHQQE
jgi:hypothetical protein